MLEERHDQHYLRRSGDRAVRRGRKRKSLLRRCLSLAAQALVLVVVFMIARQVRLFFLTSRLFEVRTIAVRGNHRAKTADLLVLASPFISTNIFRVEMARLREELCRSPWVLDASVRRSLPDALEVTVQEREPAAIVRFEGRAYLVDASGRRLAEYGPEVAEFDFPVLTGLEALPRAEAVRRIKTGAAAVVALSSSMPDLARRISEVDLSEGDRIALKLADGSPVLYLDTRDYLRNLDNFAAVQYQISRGLPGRDVRDPLKVAYVDLRFRGRIAVMPESLGRASPER